ncbi:MAG TPA: nucleotidyltransferase domain-containing protein [Longimicrobium sp.]|nr:nucleotidyltransferase domain-containing protein [Longimicrobium sp.]
MRADSDVDVLVIEEAADGAALGRATMEAGMMLGRDIDLKRYTPAELEAERLRAGTSYLKRLLAGSTQWALDMSRPSCSNRATSCSRQYGSSRTPYSLRSKAWRRRWAV